MSLTFGIEPLAECWDGMIEMARQHWNETEGYRHGQPFAPSFERYNQYAQAGWFLQFIARDGEKMAGYAGIYLCPSMHSQQLLATEDTWFLLPEYRKGRNAIQFYRFVEDECKRRGVVEIMMTAKLTNGAGRILEYLGYQVVARQFSKHLIYNEVSAQQPTAPKGAPTAPYRNDMEKTADVCTFAASRT